MVVAIHLLVFVATWITRNTPVRVSTNPWGVLTFGVMSRGRLIAPRATDTLAIRSLAIVIWARLSLGRSIGLVPALRTLVTHGAYRYVR